MLLLNGYNNQVVVLYPCTHFGLYFCWFEFSSILQFIWIFCFWSQEQTCTGTPNPLLSNFIQTRREKCSLVVGWNAFSRLSAPKDFSNRIRVERIFRNSLVQCQRKKWIFRTHHAEHFPSLRTDRIDASHRSRTIEYDVLVHPQTCKRRRLVAQRIMRKLLFYTGYVNVQQCCKHIHTNTKHTYTYDSTLW